MGISVELFRIRIGNFNCSKIKIRQIKFSNKTRELNVIKYSSVLLILSVLLFQFSHSCSSLAKNWTRNAIKVKASNIDNCRVKNALYVFSWAQSGLLINKIQKIINGNRRSVGYRLAVWNCGRGLIQEGFSVKLNEVKHFLRSKKPHCLGVIESDLFSHKLNIDG